MSRTTKLSYDCVLFMLLYFCSNCCIDVVTAAAWFVTPPTSKQDWQQLASLVVTTFDAPPIDAPPIEQFKWNLVQRSLTEEATYRKYVTTARKMKNTKYAILVAKQWGTVIGMAELGVNRGDDGDRRATIGVLCVDEKYRKQGVGNELVAKCLQLAVEVWKKEVLYAEVEPSNVGARSFFETSCGFENKDETQVMVSLRARDSRRVDQRPHLLLSYNLTASYNLTTTNAVAQSSLSILSADNSNKNNETAAL